MRRSKKQFRPFSAGNRRTIGAILVTFALISALGITLSIRATKHSQNQATVVQVVGRQRTLAERYVKEVLLVRAGGQADPALIGSVLADSAQALLDGGTAPAVNGDDDDTKVPRASGAVLRNQLAQEQRLVTDLRAAGAALLAHRPPASVRVTANEHIQVTDPVQRLRVLGALTSNVSLNASRTIVAADNKNIDDLVVLQIALGVGGLLVSLLLAWALIGATRRQSAHFRSLVQSSSDLVMILGSNGCRYVSRSLTSMVGRAEEELLGKGYEQFVHEDDRAGIEAAQRDGEPAAISFRMLNSNRDYRHLEAHVSDLRQDRHVRGVVLNARDTTERVQLEHELTMQSLRDSFGSQLSEALEMSDEEDDTYQVVERAMAEISEATPMELLLSDSSRASLERAATNQGAEAPGCPVKSPFSCVAVRRGSPAVFESSEALNACPKLRGRPGGACSAVCVPVSFMGRALGVLHATGPEGSAPSPEQVVQLTTLATQAGARIGTVRAFEKTQLQASTDVLTGLVNRRTLEKDLRGLIKQGHSFALAVGDLDHFKQLNDTHGHEAGDRALRLFAQVAQGVLREHDVVARWGGEEFVILLPTLDRFQAVAVLDRIRDKLAAAHAGDHPPFTASFGVTDTSQAETLEQLIHIADGALYRSKEHGRDRVTIGDPALDEATVTAVSRDGADAPNGRVRAGNSRPSLHEAAEDEDPHPSGHEIR